MASGTKVRGITIELGADTTGISKALGGLNAQINSTQKQLKDVEKLLKLDPKNTELLRQKQELLNKAIADSKTKVNALKDAQKQLGDRTEENAKQYDAIEREIISCTSEQKKWQDQLDAMTPKAKTLKDTLSDVSEATGKAAENTKALSIAAAGVAAGLIGNAYNAAKTADDINTLSKQYSIAVEEIQKMNYAQDVIDVSTETMLASYAKLTKQMGANNDVFAELGVTITDTNGELRDSEDVWYDTLEALSKIENETQRDVYAQELFGKSAADLAGVIDDGGEALRQMGQEAEDAGLILSGEALADANQFNDAIDKLKATASQAFLEAGASLATSLVPMLEKLVGAVSKVLQWFGNLDGTTQTIILTIAGLVASISPILTLVSTLTGLAAGLNVAMLPMIGTIGAIIAIVAALVAGGVALYKNWDKVVDAAQTLRKNVSNAFSNLKSNVVSAVSNLRNSVISLFSQAASGAKSAWNGVTSFFSGIWSGIKNIFNSVASWFKSIFGSASDGVKSSFGTVVSFFSGIWSGIKSVFSGVPDFFSGAFSNASSAIESAFSGVSSFFSSVWASVTSGLDTIDYRISQSAANAQSLASATSSYSTAYSTTGNGSISYYAKGGLLSSGFGIVGENGPELVQMTNAGAMITPLTNSTNNSFSVNVNASFNGGYSTKNARQLARAINKELGQMYG